MMKIIVIIYLIVVIICFLEAYFCAKWDTESEKYSKEKENKIK